MGVALRPSPLSGRDLNGDWLAWDVAYRSSDRARLGLRFSGG